MDKGRPRCFAFGEGLPEDSSLWQEGYPIADLLALVEEDPLEPNRLLPICTSAMGQAYLPVRVAKLASLFGDTGRVHSICQNDWSAALRAITRQIQSRLTGACWAAPLGTDAASHCTLVETMANGSGAPCPQLASEATSARTSGWQVDLGLDADGHRRCGILAADYDGDGCPDAASGSTCSCEPPYSGCLKGWCYDTDDDFCGQGMIRFTAPDLTSEGSTVEIRCRR